MIRVIKGNVERIIDDSKLDIYKGKGYRIIEVLKDECGAKEDFTKGNTNLSKMNVPQLKELAKEKNIEGYSSLNKEELLAVLKQAEQE